MPERPRASLARGYGYGSPRRWTLTRNRTRTPVTQEKSIRRSNTWTQGMARKTMTSYVHQVTPYSVLDVSMLVVYQLQQWWKDHRLFILSSDTLHQVSHPSL